MYAYMKRSDNSIQLPKSKTRCGQMLCSKNNSGKHTLVGLSVCCHFYFIFFALYCYDFHLYFGLHSPLLLAAGLFLFSPKAGETDTETQKAEIKTFLCILVSIFVFSSSPIVPIKFYLKQIYQYGKKKKMHL